MKKILVVDDNPVSRELIREALEGSKIEILEASDGKEALDRIKEEQPDLVLLDIDLPTMDGYEVLRLVRSQSRFDKVIIVALTAYAMLQDREKIVAAGFEHFISKPIDVAQLRIDVRSLLHAGKRSTSDAVAKPGDFGG